MKRNCKMFSDILLFIIAVLLGVSLTGCKSKNSADRPMKEIRIVIDTVRATQARAHFIPDNGNAFYTYGIIGSIQLEEFTTDEQIIKEQLDIMNSIFDYYSEDDDVSFNDMFLTKGEDIEVYDELKPNSDYCILAFQVDPTLHTAIGNLYKMPFHTLSIDSADVTFDVQIKGDTLLIIPSDESTYLFDYELTSVIDMDFYSPLDYFKQLVGMWEDYGFIQYEREQGPVQWVFSQNDDAFKRGEKYTLFVAGYNGEICTEPVIVEFSVQ